MNMERNALVSRSGVALVALLVGVGVVSGCGGGGKSSSSSPASTTSKTTTPAPATAPKPKGAGVTMQMGEMFFRPKQLTVSAGKVRITEHNGGQIRHEFVLARSNADPSSLPTEGGIVDEDKLKSVGEIPDVDPGQSRSHTFALKPGKYVFICNVPGHYKAGMYGSLVAK